MNKGKSSYLWDLKVPSVVSRRASIRRVSRHHRILDWLPALVYALKNVQPVCILQPVDQNVFKLKTPRLGQSRTVKFWHSCLIAALNGRLMVMKLAWVKSRNREQHKTSTGQITNVISLNFISFKNLCSQQLKENHMLR